MDATTSVPAAVNLISGDAAGAVATRIPLFLDVSRGAPAGTERRGSVPITSTRCEFVRGDGGGVGVSERRTEDRGKDEKFHSVARTASQ